jgi:ankyrin repeat protein
MLTIQSNPFLYVELIESMIFSLDYNDETPLHLAVRLELYPMCQLLLQFADKLDEIQQPCIYLDKIDGQLIRSVTKNLSLNSIFNQSRVFIIGFTNKTGHSSFHIAILYGHQHLMNLFLQHVDTFGRNYLLEHTDADIRTPLHLAALKGYTQIVKQLFLFNVNVYTRDAQESTPLHCVARCVERKCYDGNDASVCILEIFLNYIQNCKKNSFDLLTALDGFGHNCLETAIISRNRLFVEYLLNLNNIPLFKNLLCNAQFLDIHYHHIDTPLRKLVTYMPDLAYRVLDICITFIGDKRKIIYDFQFLEDQCSIEQWQYNLTSQTRKTQPIHKFCYLIFCRHKPLKFQSEFHRQPLPAYTCNAYTLVHNNVLSVMCKCAKHIDLKDQEGKENEEMETKYIQYSYKLMHHPLSKKLMELKWKQYGLPLFLASFFIYCLYLILFTTVMLRNKQPEYFYRLINATFPNARFSNGTQMVRLVILK